MAPVSEVQAVNAAIVNISGRQRMLSQRAAMLGLMLAHELELAERNRLRQSLRDVTRLLEQSHEGLLHGNAALNLPGYPSAEVRALYFDSPFNVDQRVRDYVAALQAFLDRQDQDEILLDDPSLRTITDAAASQLLPGLDAVVAQYQKESEAQQVEVERQRLQAAANEAMLLRQAQQRSRELQEAKEKADAANLSKSQFLAHMSHELRTPLNAVLGFSQLMARDQNLTPQQQDTINIINRSGSHLLSLINDVLEMSKIESGKAVLNVKNIDLPNLLNTLHEMFYLKAKSKGITLEIRSSANLPRYIRSDESKLRQILINLLSNAIKFTHQGQVCLTVESQPVLDQSSARRELQSNALSLEFTVRDTGDGIANHELDTLFEMFTQTSTGLKSSQGTGLGLAISRQFSKLMEGDITVESQVSQGTTVSLNIRALEGIEPDARVLSRPKVVGLASDQPDYRILIVEDRAENRQLMQRYMEMVGFKVATAQNGLEAIDYWEQWNPHFIWMDWQMPEMNGEEATRKIRQLECSRENKAIIVALSSSVFEDSISQTIDAGCNDFIPKPFQEAQLFDALEKHLNVRYIYDADSQAIEPSQAAKKKLTQDEISQQMQQLPEEMLLQLKRLTISLEEEQLAELIQEISKHQPNLAYELEQLLHALQLDRIADLALSAM